MAWKVEFTDIAERTIDKLDPQVRKRINSFFRERVQTVTTLLQLRSRFRESFVGCGVFVSETIA